MKRFNKILGTMLFVALCSSAQLAAQPGKVIIFDKATGNPTTHECPTLTTLPTSTTDESPEYICVPQWGTTWIYKKNKHDAYSHLWLSTNCSDPGDCGFYAAPGTDTGAKETACRSSIDAHIAEQARLNAQAPEKTLADARALGFNASYGITNRNVEAFYDDLNYLKRIVEQHTGTMPTETTTLTQIQDQLKTLATARGFTRSTEDGADTEERQAMSFLWDYNTKKRSAEQEYGLTFAADAKLDAITEAVEAEAQKYAVVREKLDAIREAREQITHLKQQIARAKDTSSSVSSSTDTPGLEAQLTTAKTQLATATKEFKAARRKLAAKGTRYYDKFFGPTERAALSREISATLTDDEDYEQELAAAKKALGLGDDVDLELEARKVKQRLLAMGKERREARLKEDATQIKAHFKARIKAKQNWQRFALKQKLASLTEDIAALEAQKPSDSSKLATWQKNYDRMIAQKEALEAELARLSAPTEPAPIATRATVAAECTTKASALREQAAKLRLLLQTKDNGESAKEAVQEMFAEAYHAQKQAESECGQAPGNSLEEKIAEARGVQLSARIERLQAALDDSNDDSDDDDDTKSTSSDDSEPAPTIEQIINEETAKLEAKAAKLEELAAKLTKASKDATAGWTWKQVVGFNVSTYLTATILQNMLEGWVGVHVKGKDSRTKKQKAVDALKAIVALEMHKAHLVELLRVFKPVKTKDGSVVPTLGARAKSYAKTKPFMTAGLGTLVVGNGYMAATSKTVKTLKAKWFPSKAA